MLSFYFDLLFLWNGTCFERASSVDYSKIFYSFFFSLFFFFFQRVTDRQIQIIAEKKEVICFKMSCWFCTEFLKRENVTANTEFLK